MCDYSLCGIPNRLAAEGEELVVHKFSTGSMGLASPADLQVPVAKAEAKKSFWQTRERLFRARPPGGVDTCGLHTAGRATDR